MSSDAGGYSGIKTVAFTISVSILILASLYLARCCNALSPQQTFFLNSFGRRHADHHLPEFVSDALSQSMADVPTISEVRIASWYPSCSPSEPQLEEPGLAQVQDNDQKREPYSSITVDQEGRSLWAGFLVSSIRIHHSSASVSCVLVPEFTPSRCPSKRCLKQTRSSPPNRRRSIMVIIPFTHHKSKSAP